MQRSIAATPKAMVLPEPVGALATTSLPARESGIAASWIGNGAAMPRSVNLATRAGSTPKSAKDTGIMTPNELTGANSSLEQEIAQPQHAADGTNKTNPT